MKSLRNLGTMLNLHLAGVAILIAVNLYIAVQLVLAWHAISLDKPEYLAADQIRYQQLHAQSEKLGLLPDKITRAGKDADVFYGDRFPTTWSQVLGELGRISAKDSVHLTRANYTQTPALNSLTNIRIDAALSGDYTAIVRFINDLERDKQKSFFLIDTITLTGQQGGLVNLRLRLTTFLRPPRAGEAVPASDAAANAAAAEASGEPASLSSTAEVQ
jgi:hypothetical protein